MNTSAIANQKAQLRRGQERSASRFLWVAGLTLVSTLTTVFTTSGYISATALGIASFVNNFAIAAHMPMIGVGFTVFLAAVFVAFWWFAKSGSVVVFMVGMGLYALDGLLLLVFKEWLAVALHAYILYRLFTGFQHALNLQNLIKSEEAELRAQRISNARLGGPN